MPKGNAGRLLECYCIEWHMSVCLLVRDHSFVVAVKKESEAKLE